MSRLSFRAALETPRPRSAFVLVARSSATLGVTGRLPAPVLVLQAALVAAAAALRTAPRAWQRRAPVLGAGVAAVALLAAAELLSGAQAAVCIAEVALLASGLQLLDARPRRSEFLLVAIALLQVVLAASLTDSLIFPPLLMAFLPTCVWTLLVHTLRSEALEAGDPAAASGAITPGLLAMTVAASALSLLLALCLFFLLPRMREGLVRAGGAPVSSSGFSDRVRLGDLGRIHADPTVMLRVQTLAGAAPAPQDAYWRGLAFDRFDGRSWSASASTRTALPGDPTVGVSPAHARGSPDLVQRILREPVAAGVLFAAGDPLQIQGATGRIERDASGSLYAPQTAQARLRYDVSARATPPSDDELARDVAAAPAGGEALLALPPLAPEIAERASKIVAGESNDLQRARAIERWLRSHGRYSNVPPHEAPGDPRSPVERFLLGELEGHCEYFATAMAVLARSVGLPARVVNGFAGGRRNRVGGFVELTGSDAHAWVEVPFRDHGWVRFDPTPPDLRLAATDEALSLRDRLAELRSALELLWFQHVIDFDRERQIGAASAAVRALGRWFAGDDDESAEAASPRDWLVRLREAPAAPVLAVVAALTLVAIGAVVWRARRTRDVSTPLPPAYARALQILARRGLSRTPALTPRAFAREVARAVGPAAGSAFAAITEAYLAERYGGHPAPATGADLRRLRDSLRE